MAYRERRGPGQYKPVDVSDLNLMCAECGVGINELPFRPMMNDDGTPARPIYCRDCNSKRKRAFGKR